MILRSFGEREIGEFIRTAVGNLLFLLWLQEWTTPAISLLR